MSCAGITASARRPAINESSVSWSAGLVERRRLRKRMGSARLAQGRKALAPNELWSVDLKRKWKAHIRLENYKSQDRVSMDAPRRQSVKV